METNDPNFSPTKISRKISQMINGLKIGNRRNEIVENNRR
jgi:hypothetical protein